MTTPEVLIRPYADADRAAVVEEDHGTHLVPEARRVGCVTDLFVAPKARRRRGLAHARISAAETHFHALGTVPHADRRPGPQHDSPGGL